MKMKVLVIEIPMMDDNCDCSDIGDDIHILSNEEAEEVLENFIDHVDETDWSIPSPDNDCISYPPFTIELRDATIKTCTNPNTGVLEFESYKIVDSKK